MKTARTAKNIVTLASWRIRVCGNGRQETNETPNVVLMAYRREQNPTALQLRTVGQFAQMENAPNPGVWST
jgi:hypothetical protein